MPCVFTCLVIVCCPTARLLADNRSLTVLELEGNQIGSAGATALAESLQANACLTTLALGANQIDDAGAIALGKSLKVLTIVAPDAAVFPLLVSTHLRPLMNDMCLLTFCVKHWLSRFWWYLNHSPTAPC